MVLETVFPGADLYVQIARFFLVFFAGMVATRLILMPAASYIASKRTDDKVKIHSYSNIAALTGIFLSFVLALQSGRFGNLVTVLGTLAAAVTVAVGFGMREQISNLVGGFFIHTDNPFVKGDYIKVNDQEGVIKEVKLRYTTINGSSSEKVVLPNSVLTLNPVKNFTSGNKTKTSVELKAEPGKMEELESIALEAAGNQEEVLEKPEPCVRYRGIEDGKTSAELLYWINDSRDSKEVKSSLIEQVSQKTGESGVFESGSENQD